MLVELTAVSQSALPLVRLKDHLRLGSGFTDDAAQDSLLAGFLRAALRAIESRTGRALYEREFRWTLPRWRGIGAVSLPVAPVTLVSAIVIRDGAGVETAVPAGLWQLRPDNTLHGGSQGLPRIPAGGQAQVDFLAGYGPEFSDLPDDLQQAVILLAAHYHDYRNDMALGAGCMPFGVTALTESYRHLRLSLYGVEMLQ